MVFTIVGYDVSVNSIWNTILQINIIDKCKVFSLNTEDNRARVGVIAALIIGTATSIVIFCLHGVLDIYIHKQKMQLKSDPLKNTKNHCSSNSNSSCAPPLQDTHFTDSDGSLVHRLSVTASTCPELHLQKAFITIQDIISSSSSDTASTISNFPQDTISTDSNSQEANFIGSDHNISLPETVISTSDAQVNTTNNIDMSSLETITTWSGSDLQQAVNVTSSSSSISTGSEPQQASSSDSDTASTISNFPLDTISTDSNSQEANFIGSDHNISLPETVISTSDAQVNTTNNIDMSSLETITTWSGSDLQQAVNVTSSSSSISTGSEPQQASSSDSDTAITISNFPQDTISTDSNSQEANFIGSDHNISLPETVISTSNAQVNTTNNIDMSSLETITTCSGSDLQQAVNVTSSSSSISTGSELQQDGSSDN